MGPDGALYVDLYETGEITKLLLVEGKETARATFIAAGTFDKADGIAFDAAGNVSSKREGTGRDLAKRAAVAGCEGVEVRAPASRPSPDSSPFR